MGKETIGVRVPPEWRQRIQQEAEAQGVSVTQWVLNAIASQLGEPTTVSGSVNTPVNPANDLRERVEALESAIAGIGEALTALTQKLEALQPTAPPKPVNTPAPPVSTVSSAVLNEWGEMADSTFRRRARELGIKTADLWRDMERGGWTREGASNRARYIPPHR